MWRIVLKIKLNFKYCVLAFCVFLFLGYERDAPLGQRGRGDGSDWKTLSVTAMPCHLSRKGEALARAGSLRFTGQLLLSSLSSSCPGGERPPSAGDKKGKGFGNPPVTARSVLSRSQRACPMRKKIGWRGFASRVKSFFRFLFSRKKERELPFS